MTSTAQTEARTEGGGREAPASRGASTQVERRRELLAYLAYRTGERVINSLPRGLALAAAAAVGNVAFDLSGKKRLIRDNLARPMGLPADDPRVGRAARRAFRNYAKYVVDVMRIGELTGAQIADLVTLVNVDLLREASAEGKGVLLCTVHVGGMDLLGAALSLEGETLHVVADDTTYGRLYDHLAEARARQKIYLIGWRSLRSLFRALRRGENLVLFCDGGFRPGDVPVELCGEATTFPPGPATLAARTGAPILPVACRRTADDRFIAWGLPLIHATSEKPREIQRASQALADALSTVLAEDPGQWYMFRAVWPQTDEERGLAHASLEAARSGKDWARAR